MKGWLALTTVLWLAACGGGGSGGGSTPPPSGGPPPTGGSPLPGTPPFGLDSRPALGALSLPADGSGGQFMTVNAFPLLSGIANALFAAGVPGEDRVVVVQQSGEIKAFANDPAVTTSRTVLDLRGRVLFSGEQGLLGLAFDPAFAQNRFLYVHYSAASPRRSVISRFTWDEATDLVSLASEKILLTQLQPFENHNGGMLAFGPDDMLYIAFGDGGSGGDPQNNAQNLGTWLGKLLRIDPHPSDPSDAYDVPADNPYVADNDAGTLGEIWASGLRNPFRFSFDRQTGALWLGDVGQSTLEEVDLIVRGANYGWRVYEGTRDFDSSGNTLPRSSFTFPVHEYGRSQGATVIGGLVYRGTALPALVGRYVYGDFISGRIWALAWDGTRVTANDEIETVTNPAAFGEDNEGELLIVSLTTGALYRLEAPSGGGSAPALLSDTGIFTDVRALTPAPGFIEYDINLPFWSDGAMKRRWLAVPQNTRIDFSPTGSWTFPVGTVAVKHFEMELTEGNPASARRLETRVLVRQPSGWSGFVYRWTDAQDDAVLIAGRETETLAITSSSRTRQQLYEYPSRTDCLRCHTSSAGSVLGVRTRQMNREFAFPNARDNQLRTYNHIGLFSTDIGLAGQYGALPDLDDATQSLATRARAYLDVNCSHCHRPGGGTPVPLDLRFDTSDAQMNAIGQTPQSGDLGVAQARVITRGDKGSSVLWLRMQRLDGERMPPLASHAVDQEAVDVIGAWIDSL